jgi:peptidoglycan/LPS O-acetylase OafA/YrhL
MVIQYSREQASGQPITQSGHAKRPHLYELDPLRIVTALCVVGVHAVALTVFLNHSAWGTLVQNAVVVALHYTREMFMFVSALALTYVYYGKPFQAGQFYKKRAIGVLTPYCIWSAIYILVNHPGLSLGAFLSTTVIAILNGSASFQLYFILISLEFYLIFPLFLRFMKLVEHHPWITLAISFVLEMVMMYLDFHYLQSGSLLRSSFWSFVNQYQASFLLTYQFYFILGGLAAIYVQQARAFLLRHGRLVALGFIVALLGLWAHFFLQITVLHETMSNAVSVLQPGMVPFSLAVIVCFSWLAARWAQRVDKDGHPKGYRLWGMLSDTSFGVYLVHVLILVALLHTLLPAMPGFWPVALRVFVIWFLTASMAVAASLLLLRIPIASRLLGRERSSKRLDMVKAQIKHRFVQPTQA